MQKINKLTEQLILDFSAYTFVLSDHFRWSAYDKSIFHPTLKSEGDGWSLLHEIAHAQLNHTNYDLDIELVSCESEAWEYAKNTLAPKYHLKINNDFIEDHLDTYRNWLNKRSSCPDCGQTGVQTQNTYRCINCRCLWRANEARVCALRRKKILAAN